MKTVVSVGSEEELLLAIRSSADLIEMRIDLAGPDSFTLRDTLCTIKGRGKKIISTIRSRNEGGDFEGSTREWRETLEPWMDVSDYVDIERAYASFAPEIRKRGVKVISSAHLLGDMPSYGDLEKNFLSLKEYGDVPKIVVTPMNREDLLVLIAFTLQSPKPICTGVAGENYRAIRAILPLFGSEFVYCHCKNPASPGQYHLDEMNLIWETMGIEH